MSPDLINYPRRSLWNWVRKTAKSRRGGGGRSRCRPYWKTTQAFPTKCVHTQPGRERHPPPPQFERSSWHLADKERQVLFTYHHPIFSMGRITDDGANLAFNHSSEVRGDGGDGGEIIFSPLPTMPCISVGYLFSFRGPVHGWYWTAWGVKLGHVSSLKCNKISLYRGSRFAFISNRLWGFWVTRVIDSLVFISFQLI